MKTYKFLLPVIAGACALSMVCTACNNDDEDSTPEQPETGVKTSELKLNITKTKTTATTCSFTITASDGNVPYLYFLVEQDEFAGLSRDRLVKKLLRNLRQEASESGQDFTSYLSQKMTKGNYTGTLTNLTPGGVYEVIAFPVTGTEVSGDVSILYFQTAFADLKECTFTVSGAWTDKGYTLSVQPSDTTIVYYFALLTKEKYDDYKKTYSDESLLTGLLGSTINSQNPSSAEDIQKYFNAFVYKGNKKLLYSTVQPGMNLMWISGGVGLAEDNTKIVNTTNVSAEEIKVEDKKSASVTVLGSYVLRDLERKDSGYFTNKITLREKE